MQSLASVQPQHLGIINGARLLLNIDAAGMKVHDWAEVNRVDIERLLQKNGALIIRGLNVLSSKQFAQILTTIFGGELLQYTYRSTPRTELKGNIYTATEYHSDLTIPQHNENAYSNRWPMRIGFLCMLPATKGGGYTPISCSRKAYDLIPKEIRDEMQRKKIRYVRNYSDLDLPWREVFQTEDKSVVEQYCLANNMKCEWLEDNKLRTSQVGDASVKHPITGDMVWFNQAHLFHVSSLEESVQQSLLSVLGEDFLPRNAYYGDGTAIDIEVLEVIRRVYDETKITFAWEKNDILLLDNMLYTHGRTPFEGDRKILVGMANPNI